MQKKIHKNIKKTIQKKIQKKVKKKWTKSKKNIQKKSQKNIQKNIQKKSKKKIIKKKIQKITKKKTTLKKNDIPLRFGRFCKGICFFKKNKKNAFVFPNAWWSDPSISAFLHFSEKVIFVFSLVKTKIWFFVNFRFPTSDKFFALVYLGR